MPIRPTRSRSIKDLIQTISEQENVAFAGNDVLPPVETPTIGEPSGNTALGAEVAGGAIEGFKENPNDSLRNRAKAAATGAKDALLDDDNIKALLELFK